MIKNIIHTSGHSDALNPNNDRRFSPVVESTLIRRPQAPLIAEKLRKENPGWSAQRCLVEAKILATQKAK